MPLIKTDRLEPDLSGYLSATRTYCRLGQNTSQDDLLSSLMGGAILEIEGMISGPVAVSTYEMLIDNQPDLILLPFSQTISIESVTTKMSNTLEDIDQYGKWQWDTWRLYLAPGETWDTSDRQYALMKIEFTAGFEVIPAGIILALKDIVKWRFSNDVDNYPSALLEKIEQTLAPFKRVRIG